VYTSLYAITVGDMPIAAKVRAPDRRALPRTLEFFISRGCAPAVDEVCCALPRREADQHHVGLCAISSAIASAVASIPCSSGPEDPEQERRVG